MEEHLIQLIADGDIKQFKSIYYGNYNIYSAVCIRDLQFAAVEHNRFEIYKYLLDEMYAKPHLCMEFIVQLDRIEFFKYTMEVCYNINDMKNPTEALKVLSEYNCANGMPYGIERMHKYCDDTQYAPPDTNLIFEYIIKNLLRYVSNNNLLKWINNHTFNILNYGSMSPTQKKFIIGALKESSIIKLIDRIFIDNNITESAAECFEILKTNKCLPAYILNVISNSYLSDILYYDEIRQYSPNIYRFIYNPIIYAGRNEMNEKKFKTMINKKFKQTDIEHIVYNSNINCIGYNYNNNYSVNHSKRFLKYVQKDIRCIDFLPAVILNYHEYTSLHYTFEYLAKVIPDINSIKNTDLRIFVKVAKRKITREKTHIQTTLLDILNRDLISDINKYY